jgi:hypothetical protein
MATPLLIVAGIANVENPVGKSFSRESLVPLCHDTARIPTAGKIGVSLDGEAAQS